jgi:hypothetical protein
MYLRDWKVDIRNQLLKEECIQETGRDPELLYKNPVKVCGPFRTFRGIEARLDVIK